MTAEMESTVFEDVAAWVDAVFRPTFSRSGDVNFRWCPRWHDHPEAVLRLESLWRAWEHLREQQLGVSTWLRDHLDPQIGVLCGSVGTFARCTDRHHEVGMPLAGLQRLTDASGLGVLLPAARLLLEGHQVDAIARRLHVSERTAHRRLSALYQLLQVDGRAGAVDTLRRLEGWGDVQPT